MFVCCVCSRPLSHGAPRHMIVRARVSIRACPGDKGAPNLLSGVRVNIVDVP